MLESLWKILPSYIRWPIIIGIFFFLLPIKLREEAVSFVDNRVFAALTPIQARTEIEMKHLREDIATIKQDTRDIKNHLISRGK